MVRPKKSLDTIRYDELVIFCIKKDRRQNLLQDWGLIPKIMKCSKCRRKMNLKRKRDCESGFSWCCKKPCNSKRSIYDNSYFSDCRIDFLKFIKFTYLIFNDDIGPKKAIYELKMSRSTYYHYKRKLESVMLKDFILSKIKIGGPDTEVQIDESLFNKRKYNKGRKKSQIWVFGGVEVGTNRCFFDVVRDRTKVTLHRSIEKHILMGGDLVSDMWKSYIGLSEKGFSHYTVNHSLNFVNPLTRKHTQTIEGLWSLAKKKIHAVYGINRGFLQKHLDIFAWRRTFKRTFSYFVKIIK
ncbi:hypothetical protein DMUE_0705 [Dictyocoela muelleri]|nr:hypothetical protein DMUE_0705 [Dictyocoela muelleri]